MTGPEDPKLVATEGRKVLAFDSKPPHGGDVSTCRRDAEGFTDAVAQMYVSGFIEPETPMVGYRLSYGQQDVAEKNWIPFSYKERRSWELRNR